MLERLHISTFAVARSVTVDLAPGLNVFTGETGAGKSLVVDALAFLCGGRRGREVIATGEDHATVIGTMRLDGQPITVERTVTLSGRSSSRIDGVAVTGEEARKRFANLVEIHGQAEQLAILRPAVQLAALDAYAGVKGERAEVGAIVRELRDVRARLELLSSNARERERLLDQLRYELAEITEAALSSGEDVALREEKRRLAARGRLIEAATAAMGALEGAPLGEVVRAAEEIVERDGSGSGLLETALSLQSTAAELAREFRLYREGLDEDPARLVAIDERLDRIARLCRKYGATVEDVLGYAAEASARLGSLTGATESIEDLERRSHELLDRLGGAAERLSLARRAHAGKLVHTMHGELEHLGMGGAALAIGFACEEDLQGPQVRLPGYEVIATESPLFQPAEPFNCAFSESGLDRVELLASFNPGETPRPLATVASGGETSRLLLALTTVLGSVSPSMLTVLDEVDEGVGGRSGALVGEALLRLARSRQVVCITHLPQVAAFGQKHFVVTKQTDGKRTWSDVQEVTGDARRDEIAAMLGGASETNRRASEELLAAARPRRE